MSEEKDNCIVRLKRGSVRGGKVIQEDVEYYSFWGIRYAKAPIGKLRFKAPEAVDPWNEILDASKPGPICPQFESLIHKEWMGDEDCLFLNIFIPAWAWNEQSVLLPIMVYVHGGGYTHGTGEHYSPEYFMQNGSLILITINYRLGPLGFCNLETDEIPGNAGLLDILFALHWIQENIVEFRGDVNNVTLCGFSAGGGAVHLLALSPLSKGLFHRVIAISGSALNTWVIKESSKSNTLRLARILGFEGPDDDLKKAEDVLKNTPPFVLVKNMNKAFSSEESEEIFDLVFVPNWKSGYPSDNALFPSSPDKLIHTCQVPILFGLTSLEGGSLIDEIEMKPNLSKILMDDPKFLIPKDVRLRCQSEEKLKYISNEIKNKFFKEDKIKSGISQSLFELLSFQSFNIGVLNSLQLHATKSPTPVYFYLFDLDNTINSFGRHLYRSSGYDFTNILGAFHGDEHRFLFPMEDIFSQKLNNTEENLKKKIIQLFSNFSKYGTPTIDLEENKISLKPYKKENPNYLYIMNNSFQIKQEEPLTCNISLWNHICNIIN